MAKTNETTVDINVKISDETALKCANILTMYLNDNKNKILNVVQMLDGESKIVLSDRCNAKEVDKSLI